MTEGKTVGRIYFPWSNAHHSPHGRPCWSNTHACISLRTGPSSIPPYRSPINWPTVTHAIDLAAMNQHLPASATAPFTIALPQHAIIRWGWVRSKAGSAAAGALRPDVSQRQASDQHRSPHLIDLPPRVCTPSAALQCSPQHICDCQREQNASPEEMDEKFQDQRPKSRTRHRASTSMYLLIFRVRVTTPPQYGGNGTASLQKTSRTQQARRFYPWWGESSPACVVRAVGLAVYSWALPRIFSVAIATQPVHRLQIRPTVHN